MLGEVLKKSVKSIKTQYTNVLYDVIQYKMIFKNSFLYPENGVFNQLK